MRGEERATARDSSDRIVAAEGYLDRNVYWPQLAPDRQIPAGPYDRAPGGPLQEPCVGKGVEHVTAVVRAQVPQTHGLREGQLETRHLDEFRSHAIDDIGEAHTWTTSNHHAIRTSAGVCAYVACVLHLVVSSLPRRTRISRYTNVLLWRTSDEIDGMPRRNQTPAAGDGPSVRGSVLAGRSSFPRATETQRKPSSVPGRRGRSRIGDCRYECAAWPGGRANKQPRIPDSFPWHARCGSDERLSASTAIRKNAMTNVMIRVRALLRDDNGQDLTEYGLLACLIAVVAIAALGGLGIQVNTLWSGIIAGLESVL